MAIFRAGRFLLVSLCISLSHFSRAEESISEPHRTEVVSEKQAKKKSLQKRPEAKKNPIQTPSSGESESNSFGLFAILFLFTFTILMYYLFKKIVRDIMNTLFGGSRKSSRQRTSDLPQKPDRSSNCDALDRLVFRYIKDTEKFLKSSLNASNYATTISKLDKLVEFFEDQRIAFDRSLIREIKAAIKNGYEDICKREAIKNEQKRIKEKMRVEAKEERELESELKRLEKERLNIQDAIDKILKEHSAKHEAELESLRLKLKEVEDRNARAVSLAQQTKSGHIYVISNIGSFGKNIYKIGMSRRIEPMERIDELSNASVPFRFDVHMMIYSENAPELESVLHEELNAVRVNKANCRKEFFRTSIEEISKLVEKHHGKEEYRETAEALEYLETLAIEEQGLIKPYSKEFEAHEELDEAS
jgi:hypothetical protein